MGRRTTAQEYDTEGCRRLFSAVILQAMREATQPGLTGWHARFWLDVVAVPTLEALGVDARLVKKFVDSPSAVSKKILPK